MVKRSKTNWTPIIVVAVVIVAAALGYSVYYFYSSGSAEQGIVVCNPQDPSECLWQDHIHALVLISIDGVVQDLPTEKGPLAEGHTHEERNVMHWHSSVPYDPVKREIIDKTSLTLESSLRSAGVELPEGGRLFVKKASAWERRAEYGGYVWSDRDIIFVAKDSRSDGETLAYLQAANINLPYLGAG